MAVEISGSDMFFQAISRTGQIVDSGTIRRQARTGGTAPGPDQPLGAGAGR
jgi:hypothetical protein